MKFIENNESLATIVTIVNCYFVLTNLLVEFNEISFAMSLWGTTCGLLWIRYAQRTKE